LVHAPFGPEAAPSAADRVEVESDAPRVGRVAPGRRSRRTPARLARPARYVAQLGRTDEQLLDEVR
jgi:hypothetical protein